MQGLYPILTERRNSDITNGEEWAEHREDYMLLHYDWDTQWISLYTAGRLAIIIARHPSPTSWPSSATFCYRQTGFERGFQSNKVFDWKSTSCYRLWNSIGFAKLVLCYRWCLNDRDRISSLPLSLRPASGCFFNILYSNDYFYLIIIYNNYDNYKNFLIENKF